jgi:glyoxylase-like metal-dependent hydrolase (beta-lactamase superfamily II)
LAEYEIYAIRYGGHEARTRATTFLSIDPHDTAPMPIYYYVWVIRGGGRIFMVDAGMDKEEAERRGRTLDRLPREGLALLDVDADRLEEVIVTHLHYDHAGTLGHYPKARFHLHETEMAYTTGRCMTYDHLREPYSCEHVVQMVRHVFSGRVVFHDRDREIADGISVHHIGGHAKGIMAVRVATARGPVVLASDATHFYENVERYRPFIIVHDVEAVLRGYDRLRDLAGGRLDRIIPGHDPLVMARYPAPDPRLDGIVARLDVEPRTG